MIRQPAQTTNKRSVLSPRLNTGVTGHYRYLSDLHCSGWSRRLLQRNADHVREYLGRLSALRKWVDERCHVTDALLLRILASESEIMSRDSRTSSSDFTAGEIKFMNDDNAHLILAGRYALLAWNIRNTHDSDKSSRRFSDRIPPTTGASTSRSQLGESYDVRNYRLGEFSDATKDCLVESCDVMNNYLFKFVHDMALQAAVSVLAACDEKAVEKRRGRNEKLSFTNPNVMNFPFMTSGNLESCENTTQGEYFNFLSAFCINVTLAQTEFTRMENRTIRLNTSGYGSLRYEKLTLTTIFEMVAPHWVLVPWSTKTRQKALDDLDLTACSEIIRESGPFVRRFQLDTNKRLEIASAGISSDLIAGKNATGKKNVDTILNDIEKDVIAFERVSIASDRQYYNSIITELREEDEDDEWINVRKVVKEAKTLIDAGAPEREERVIDERSIGIIGRSIHPPPSALLQSLIDIVHTVVSEELQEESYSAHMLLQEFLAIQTSSASSVQRRKMKLARKEIEINEGPGLLNREGDFQKEEEVDNWKRNPLNDREEKKLEDRDCELQNEEELEEDEYTEDLLSHGYEFLVNLEIMKASPDDYIRSVIERTVEHIRRVSLDQCHRFSLEHCPCHQLFHVNLVTLAQS